jgi:hypothetical protein
MSRSAAAVQRGLATTGLPEVVLPAPLPVGSGPSVYGELIARLFYSSNPVRTVFFVSFGRGEGVTYTVNRLAAELQSNAARQVAVVASSDLAARRTQPILGVPQPYRVAEPKSRLLELGRDFDFVLIDGGSIAGGSTSVELMALADAVVLVVEAGHTRKEDVDRAVATISASGGRMAGFVFNKHKHWVPAWLERLFA